jgi:tyrosine-protein phosphatase YwqE
VLFDFSKLKTKKEDTTSDFSFIGVDIHSHLVPGVDDGSDSLDTSLLLVSGLASLGYRRLITTPHIRPGYFPNTRENLTRAFNELKAAVEASGLEVEIALGAEYFVDSNFINTLEKESLLTLSDNYVLIEISTFSPPPNLFDILFQMRIKGYRPILAHPERYFFYSSAGSYEKLKDFGCYFQMNILSLSGHYGKEVREAANRLFKGGMVDFLGTDLHHLRHFELMRKMEAENPRVVKALREASFQNHLFS